MSSRRSSTGHVKALDFINDETTRADAEKRRRRPDRSRHRQADRAGARHGVVRQHHVHRRPDPVVACRSRRRTRRRSVCRVRRAHEGRHQGSLRSQAIEQGAEEERAADDRRRRDRGRDLRLARPTRRPRRPPCRGRRSRARRVATSRRSSATSRTPCTRSIGSRCASSPASSSASSARRGAARARCSTSSPASTARAPDTVETEGRTRPHVPGRRAVPVAHRPRQHRAGAPARRCRTQGTPFARRRPARDREPPRVRDEATARAFRWDAPAGGAALARSRSSVDVLLMDEPFGALDAMTRDVLHDEIERHLARAESRGALRHAQRPRGRSAR